MSKLSETIIGEMESRSVDYHRHCQATVLSANGTGNQNGSTWSVLNGLNLPYISTKVPTWLDYFKENKTSITQDLKSILELMDETANAIKVQYNQNFSSGTSSQKIGEITIGTTTTEIYAPKVTVQNIITTGTAIASINGTTIYAPNAGSTTSVQVTPVSFNNPINVATITVNNSSSTIKIPKVECVATCTEGTEIGRVYVGTSSVPTTLYAPNPPDPTEVIVTPIQTISGSSELNVKKSEVAKITVDNKQTILYSQNGITVTNGDYYIAQTIADGNTRARGSYTSVESFSSVNCIVYEVQHNCMFYTSFTDCSSSGAVGMSLYMYHNGITSSEDGWRLMTRFYEIIDGQYGMTQHFTLPVKQGTKFLYMFHKQYFKNKSSGSAVISEFADNYPKNLNWDNSQITTYPLIREYKMHWVPVS